MIVRAATKKHPKRNQGPDRRDSATIEDVARKARVSIATVSRVLNKVPRGVGESLSKRVIKAARELTTGRTRLRGACWANGPIRSDY